MAHTHMQAAGFSHFFCLLLGKVCTYYRCCLFVNMSVFLKSPTHYVLHSTCSMQHAINARAVLASRKLATPATRCQLQSTKLNRSLSRVALSAHLATTRRIILHIIKITWLLKCLLLLQCTHLKRSVSLMHVTYTTCLTINASRECAPSNFASHKA